MNGFARAIACAVLMTSQTILAQEQRAVTLVERVPFPGEVERVLLIAMTDGASPELVSATWIAPHDGEDYSCIGRVSLHPVAERLKVLAVIEGARGEVRSAYREFAADELPPTLYLSLSELRARFVERRGAFRQLRNEVEAQQERIRTLQGDADAIAMVSRIVSAEDDLSDVKVKLKRVALAHEGVDRRAQQMKLRPQPLNAQKREAELVGQLGELSQALSAAETQALKKLSGAKGELQEKLLLIEETRDEHITILEEDLARLQKVR